METHISLHRRKLAQRAQKVKEPILQELIYLVVADRRPMSVIEAEAGYSEGTFRSIVRDGRQPSLSKVIELGDTLGYKLKWVKK